MKRASHWGLSASCALGHVCFLGTHQYMYFFPDLFPRVAVIECSAVCRCIYTHQSRSGVCVAEAATNPRNIHSCKTIISRGLLGFCFVFLVLEILITNKKSSEFCRNTGFYTILKKLSVWDRKQKWGILHCKKLQSEEFWRQSSRVQWHKERLLYSFDFFVFFCFLFFF